MASNSNDYNNAISPDVKLNNSRVVVVSEENDGYCELADGLNEYNGYDGYDGPIDDQLGTTKLVPLSTREEHDYIFLQDIDEELPQGRHLGMFAVIVNFISRILGSGIFATPALIYGDTGGSPFIFFLVWTLAALISFSGLFVYMELGSIVRKNGGTKSFLEFLYYKPRMLMSVMISIYSVVFGFVISNSIIFGQYFLYSLGIEEFEDRDARYAALTLVLVSFIIHCMSTKGGTIIQNILGFLKLALLIAMGFIGIYVLFPKSITNLESNLKAKEFFKIKTEVSVASITAAIFKASYSFAGWNGMHTLSGEIKNPVRTMKIAGPISLLIVFICYLFLNLAYLIVIPTEELIGSAELAGSLLFQKIFGYAIGRRLLTLSVALCAGGNVFVVMYSTARMNQEVFREGFMPFSKFFASNWPLGTPFPSLFICCIITSIFLIFPPPGNLYDYVVNLESYGGQVFITFVLFGLFIFRKRYPNLKAPIRAPLITSALAAIFSLCLLIGPFISDSQRKSSNGDDTIPNYALLCCLFLGCCALYWALKFRLLPWFFGYQLIKTEQELADGLTIKKWEYIYA
ncbi:hypothetical protein PACTADRAFT_782 [Pachysolen tannophilus NRRL Y-2460]|uniref:Amino acid permease/ SLC12A domain-containing protein n=1 Tax=Pachysolen tannophilus NRRL Y-2460 TaxID=669874 RepID=A0A1E4U2S4_PACTA|nr:hypothetical protein PACTADRAFT_782 [Pachysolen tannophilus NRRL Y-2460]